MFLVNLMLFLKVQYGFDEDLITNIIMKLIFNWLLCLYCYYLLCYKSLLLP
jgi:hypothetical protein